MPRLTPFIHNGSCNREDGYGEECWACARYAARSARVHKQRLNGQVEPFYVVGYRIDRCYGGPQEGGWWYDHAYTCEVRKCYDWRDGLKAARELREDFKPDKRGRSSVIGGPDGYVGVYRDPKNFPGEDFERPHYE